MSWVACIHIVDLSRYPWIWKVLIIRVLAVSHATMLKKQQDCDRPGYRISQAATYSLEESRSYDSSLPRTHHTPRNRYTQRKPRSIRKDGLLTWILFWGLFSLPGLLFSVSDRWGFFSSIFAGLAFCWLGAAWSGLCPAKNYILRYGVGVVGVMLVVNAFITLIIPPLLLLIVAMVLFPIGVGRFYGEKA